MNKTNKQRDKKTKTKSSTCKPYEPCSHATMQPCKPCKPCIHAKNDLNEPRVPKWA